jgi:hypothetical protein
MSEALGEELEVGLVELGLGQDHVSWAIRTLRLQIGATLEAPGRIRNEPQ